MSSKDSWSKQAKTNSSKNINDDRKIQCGIEDVFLNSVKVMYGKLTANTEKMEESSSEIRTTKIPLALLLK